ncbi:MAG: protein phosphatase 2C domain-containing protein [Verrucomicrobiota bacterium]
MKLRSAALTDIGKVRHENQDTPLCQPALGLFGVADGVGGLPGGAEASQCAVRTLIQAVRAAGDSEPDMRAVLELANAAVQRLGQLVSPETGIGTTVSCGLFRAGRTRLAHVGDSRAYLLRGGKFSPVTEDHTVEVEARKNNTSGEYLLLHPQSGHTLTRCVGQPMPLDTDLAEHALAAGDRWLFATDGVTRMVPDAELAELLGRPGEPSEILSAMIALALERGGTDNATAVLVIVDEA